MQVNVGCTYLVAFEFAAQDEGELSVKKDQVVRVLEEEDAENPGWIYCEAENGVRGYVPRDFIGVERSLASKPSMTSAGSIRGFAGLQNAASSRSLSSRSIQQQVSNRSLSSQQASSRSLSTANPYMQLAEGVPLQQPEDGANFSTILNYWQERDLRYGSGRLPKPQLRRWYYRDIFNDMQGPFNPEEMRERLEARHINENSKILIEVGTGACIKYEENLLSALYPSRETAFRQAPAIAIGNAVNELAWYYLDDNNREQGPFSGDQMKLWFNDGYFGSDTKVRIADNSTKYEELSAVFPEPSLVFSVLPNFANAAEIQKGLNRAKSSSHMISADIQAKQQAMNLDYLVEANNNAVPVAIGGDVPMVPPAIGSKASLSDALNDNDYEEVHLHNNNDNNDNQDIDPNGLHSHIYGSNWGDFKGIPDVKIHPNSYATNLYTFLTRPLHPNAGIMQCYIRRDIDGSHINFNKYVLYLEKGNVPLLAAYKHHHTLHNYYDIKMNTTGKNSDCASGLTIANLELSFLGTDFLLHNNVSGHQGKPRDLCCVTYEKKKVSSKRPRKMRVAIPAILDSKPEFYNWQHKGMKHSGMISSLKSLNISNLVPLLNKPPKWNEKKKAYMLDFKGRVTRASVKNFQCVDAINDPQHNSVILQHGRVGANKFTMDAKHPISLLQSFAISLSSLHSKKAVD